MHIDSGGWHSKMNDQIPLPLVCHQILVCRLKGEFRVRVINMASLLSFQGISFCLACPIHSLLIVFFFWSLGSSLLQSRLEHLPCIWFLM
jgi:hypothetical protein